MQYVVCWTAPGAQIRLVLQNPVSKMVCLHSTVLRYRLQIGFVGLWGITSIVFFSLWIWIRLFFKKKNNNSEGVWQHVYFSVAGQILYHRNSNCNVTNKVVDLQHFILSLICAFILYFMKLQQLLLWLQGRNRGRKHKQELISAPCHSKG